MKTGAVCIIENDYEEILLLKRVDFPGNKIKGWCLPGGKIDTEDKTLDDGIRREVFEETGLYVHVEYIGESTSIIADKYPMKVFVFYANIKKSDKIKLSEREHSDWIWTDKPEDFELAGNTLKFIKLNKRIER